MCMQTEEHVLRGTQSLGFSLIIGCSLLTIFLRSLRVRKTAWNRNCADWWRAENSDEDKTLILVQTATNTATPMS